jgi:hypothetical protein
MSQAQCTINTNEHGDIVVTFHGGTLTLNPGETLTISSEKTVFMSRERYEVLMAYYNWKSEGQEFSHDPRRPDVMAPPVNESFPITKRALRRLGANLRALLWKTM